MRSENERKGEIRATEGHHGIAERKRERERNAQISPCCSGRPETWFNRQFQAITTVLRFEYVALRGCVDLSPFRTLPQHVVSFESNIIVNCVLSLILRKETIDNER